MPKKKNTILRFAFGTKERPGSSVWRANIVRKTGDIYLLNSPQLGNAVHVALHASGKFHVKTGGDKYILAGPWRDEYDLLWGPVIFFYEWLPPIAPPAPTGSTEEIRWLGWPEKDHLLMVKTQYGPVGVEVLPHPDEERLFEPIRAKVNGEEMDFHLFVQHRPMSEEEKVICSKSPLRAVTFQGMPLPLDMEVVRVSPGGPARPASISHERFTVQTQTLLYKRMPQLEQAPFAFANKPHS